MVIILFSYGLDLKREGEKSPTCTTIHLLSNSSSVSQKKPISITEIKAKEKLVK